MGGFDDLFPETIPPSYTNEEEARALMWGLISDWFGTLSYQHNESTHAAILDSLILPGMAEVVMDASLHVQDEPINFHEFAAGVRRQAQAARAAGLVVPDGKPRRKRAQTTGDLFGGEGEE